MIVTPLIALRMTAIVIAGVILQITFFSRVELFHTSPDILPSVVASLGLLGGSMTGAVAGFSAGFLLDCLLIAPLGASSLVLLTTGYLAGLYRERFDLGTKYTPPLLCMGLTLFALTAAALMEIMLGVDAPVSALIVRDILIKTIYGFLLGWPIYLATKLALRAALVDDRTARAPRPAVSS